MLDQIANSINIYLIITLYSSLILLSFLLISNALKVNRKANFLFGVFLFLWSTYWIEEILLLVQAQELSPLLEILLRGVQFLTPIFFYFSIILFSNPEYKLKLSDSLFLAVPILYWVLLLLDWSTPGNPSFRAVLIGMIFLHSIYYVIRSYLQIRQHKEQLSLFSSSIEEKDLQWIEFIIISLFALAVVLGIYNLVSNGEYLNLFANLFSCAIVFFVGFHVVRQKEIFSIKKEDRVQIIADNLNEGGERRKLLSTPELDQLKAQLIDIMKMEKPYLDPELSLLQLSNLLQITPHQLSYLINEGFNENFFTFVNRYRIEMVKKLLHNPDKKSLSILGIAYESGFNSKTAFYRTFKKITSQTPSEYLKKSSTL